jgi:hypothetical protein
MTVSTQFAGVRQMRSIPYFLFTALPVVLGLSACGSKPTVAPEKPAKLEAVGHESDLLKLTLSAQAIERLGIQTVRASGGENANRLMLHGEVVIPPAGGGMPVTSSSDLATLATNQARADGDVMRSRAELDIALKNAARAEALVREEAGSARLRDEALAAVAVARSNLHVAQTQRAQYGPPITAMTRTGRAWVRVPVPAGDVARIDRSASARIAALGESDIHRTAQPVNGPPSANAAAATVDLYYALDNGAAPFRVGQRVAVELAAQGQSRGLSIPDSAILRDIYGGEWVYIATGARSFERRRIEIASIQGGHALLARGLTPGANVVIAGAAELFGTEFGTK